MMKTPVIYSDCDYQHWPDLLLPHCGKRVIAIEIDNEWCQYGPVADSGYIDRELFFCGKFHTPRIKNHDVTWDKFLDKLCAEFTDQFEWLLFHPEFLP